MWINPENNSQKHSSYVALVLIQELRKRYEKAYSKADDDSIVIRPSTDQSSLELSLTFPRTGVGSGSTPLIQELPQHYLYFAMWDKWACQHREEYNPLDKKRHHLNQLLCMPPYMSTRLYCPKILLMDKVFYIRYTWTVTGRHQALSIADDASDHAGSASFGNRGKWGSSNHIHQVFSMSPGLINIGNARFYVLILCSSTIMTLTIYLSVMYICIVPSLVPRA